MPGPVVQSTLMLHQIVHTPAAWTHIMVYIVQTVSQQPIEQCCSRQEAKLAWQHVFPAEGSSHCHQQEYTAPSYLFRSLDQLCFAFIERQETLLWP